MSKLVTVFTILFICCTFFVYSEVTEYPLKFVTIENDPDHVLKTTSITIDKEHPGPGDTLLVNISWNFNNDWRDPKSLDSSLDYFTLSEFLRKGSDFIIDMTAKPDYLFEVDWYWIASALGVNTDTKRSKDELISLLFGDDWDKVKNRANINLEDEEYHCIVSITFPQFIPPGNTKLEGSISSGNITWIKFNGTYNKDFKSYDE